jgi:hypothetical protein
MIAHRKSFSPATFLFLLLALIVSCGKTSSDEGETIDVPEPETYRAKIFYSYLPDGNRGVKPNPLFSLDVARQGPDRRYTFHFGNDEVSYLEGTNQRYLIAPSCRQYVEATLEQLNFRIPNSMAPEEIIDRLRKARGFRRSGEEQVDGRVATRYVSEEKTILIDQETRLPLRVELISRISSPDAEKTHGKIYLIIELRDPQPDADAVLFQPPNDYREVKPQELCPQVNQLAQSAMQLLWTISVKENQTSN